MTRDAAGTRPSVGVVFVSPLRSTVAKGQGGRPTKRVSMRMLTAGEPAVMTLSYPDMPTARQARNALLEAGNVYAVTNERLWRGLCEALTQVSQQVL